MGYKELITSLKALGLQTIRFTISPDVFEAVDSYAELPWKKFDGKLIYVDPREDDSVLFNKAKNLIGQGYKYGAIEFDEGESAFFKSPEAAKEFLAAIKKLPMEALKAAEEDVDGEHPITIIKKLAGKKSKVLDEAVEKLYSMKLSDKDLIWLTSQGYVDIDYKRLLSGLPKKKLFELADHPDANMNNHGRLAGVDKDVAKHVALNYGVLIDKDKIPLNEKLEIIRRHPTYLTLHFSDIKNPPDDILILSLNADYHSTRRKFKISREIWERYYKQNNRKPSFDDEITQDELAGCLFAKGIEVTKDGKIKKGDLSMVLSIIK